MNSKQKGDITELEVMLAFKKLGYSVLIPYGDCDRYDLVINDGDVFIKIQCKTSRSENDGASFVFSCDSSHRKEGKVIHHTYSKKEIDYFATCFKGQCYLIPVDECNKIKILRILPSKNSQTQNIVWAKDYELEKIVENW